MISPPAPGSVYPHRVVRRIPRLLHAVCGVGSAVGIIAASASMAACGHDAVRDATRDATVAGASRAGQRQIPSVSNPADIRDRDIEFYAARAERDPTGAMDLAQLGSLYLQRAREMGDPRDAIRAEQVARRSLHNRGAHNIRAAQVLSTALLSQHRFAEALTVAQRISDSDTSVVQFRAAVGEIEMELGQYDSARTTFNALRWDARDPSVAPRLSRWDEIEGNSGEAKQLMRIARVDAMKIPGITPEQAGWFWLRSGDIEFRTGNPAAAEDAYRKGLLAHPDDYRLLAALAHASAARQEWKEAVMYGERAIAMNLDPATLGILSDSYAALGDSARAAEYARVLDVAVLKQPGAYHRAWSLFLLDHGQHIDVVHRKILEELKTRRDIYGYDLLAWSLHRQGRDAEAQLAMLKALSQGTQDAQLFYHAGMIDHALGHDVTAREYLTKALTVNPYFHPTQPGVARATLDSLPR